VRNGFYLFDTHCHLGNAQHSGRSYSVDSLLRDMDSYGIDRSVVIPFPVVLDHRLQHDIIGDAIRMHPDRLTGAACLSPFRPLAEFRDEVHRCRDRYGFRVLKLRWHKRFMPPLWANLFYTPTF